MSRSGAFGEKGRRKLHRLPARSGHPAAALGKSCSFWLVTGFGSGLARWAPGTLGTLVGLLLYLPVKSLSPALFLALLLLLIPLSIYLCTIYSERSGDRDPSWIVLDEIVGFWVAMVGAPLTWQAVVGGFLLFRLFDIWKPWPIRFVERLPAGFGIVLDDLVAGIYAAFALNFFFLKATKKGEEALRFLMEAL